MNKQNFIDTLRAKLSGLPSQELEERLAFYGEMIDDLVEDGLTEEDAVERLGCSDDLASQIISEIPLAKIAKERIKPKRRLKAFEIVLLAVGSPIWLSLGIAAFAVMLSIYVVIWSLVVSLWALWASLSACALGGITAGIAFICQGNVLPCFAVIGVALVCGGLAILLFHGCSAASSGTVLLTKKIALGIKKLFIKKEKV